MDRQSFGQTTDRLSEAEEINQTWENNIDIKPVWGMETWATLTHLYNTLLQFNTALVNV